MVNILNKNKRVVVRAGISVALCLSLVILAACGCTPADKKKTPSDASMSTDKNNPGRNPAVPAAKPPSRVLIIGNIPSENVLEKEQRYVPLCRYLEQKIQAQVKFTFEPDYDSIVRGMKRREFDLVMPGSLGYVKGHPAGYNAILAPMSNAPYYQGMLIARADSGIKTLDDLKGRSICFTDRGSASGYLYPMVLLREAGLVPDRDFTVGFVKGHDNVVLNVFLNQYDAGACFHGAHMEVYRSEPEKSKQIKVITLTEKIYNAPIAARDDLEPELVERIVEAFCSLDHTLEGQKILTILGDRLTDYVLVDDSYYDSVRKMLRYKLEMEKN